LDECRDHAASLAEPPDACVLAETQLGGGFSSQPAGADE
jgi:hypothetical protein